jgi:hypothetical protein
MTAMIAQPFIDLNSRATDGQVVSIEEHVDPANESKRKEQILRRQENRVGGKRQQERRQLEETQRGTCEALLSQNHITIGLFWTRVRGGEEQI